MCVVCVHVPAGVFRGRVALFKCRSCSLPVSGGN